MRSVDFDLAVIGAGPAGAACALAAARDGLRVALFEARGSVFTKPCGEGILPFGVDALASLGLDSVIATGRSWRRLVFRVQDAAPLELELERAGCAIPRTRLLAAFDAALRAERDVARVDARVEARRSPAGFELRAASGSIWRARVLVAADGAGAKSLAWLRGPARPSRSQRLGLSAHFTTREPLEHVEVHLGNGCEIYLTPLPDSMVNVAVLLEAPPAGVRGAAALVAWALARTPLAADRLGHAVSCAGARTLDHAPPRLTAADDAFLAGDAAGHVDPILGCGIALALASGIRAAQSASALRAGAASALIAREYRSAWSALVRRRRMLAKLLRATSAHPRTARLFVALLRRSADLRRHVIEIAAGPPSCLIDAPGAGTARGSVPLQQRLAHWQRS